MEAKTKIHKFLYNLSTDNFSGAEKDLKNILAEKVKAKFNAEYEAVKEKLKKKVVKENWGVANHTVNTILDAMDDAGVIAGFSTQNSKVTVLKQKEDRGDDSYSTTIDLKLEGKAAEELIQSVEEYKNTRLSAFGRIARYMRQSNEATAQYTSAHVRGFKVKSPNEVLIRFQIDNGVG